MIGEYPGDRCGAWTSFPSGIVSGSPTRSATSGGLNTWSRSDLGGTRLTYTLDAGESVVWAALEDWTYGEPPDAELARGYWILQTDGGGTLEVEDAYDLGYDFPPIPAVTFTDRAFVGEANSLFYYEMDPAFLDASHLYNDGQPLIRVTCTAGTAAITFIGAQLEQTAGYFQADGGWAWSGTQPATTQVRSLGDFGMWDTSGTGMYGDWVIDGTPVLHFPEFGPSDQNFGHKNGSGTSLVDVDDALDLRDADYGIDTGGVPAGQVVTTTYSDGGGIIGASESWSAAIDETPATYSCPTMANLPTTPPGAPPVGYLNQGVYDYLDSDSGFLGYRIGPADGVTAGFRYKGDAGTLNVYVNTFNTSPDPATIDYYSGTLINTVGKSTNDNLWDGTLDPSGGGELVDGMPQLDIDTSDNFMVLSLDCSIRTVDEFRHTGMPSGSFAPQSITASDVDVFNLPVYYRYRLPPWRYRQPTFVLVPGPGGVVSWVRNVQRNDGLGVSPWRWGSNVKVNVRVVGITFSGFGSNQSIRWRGTR